MYIGLIDADLLDNGTRHPNLALMKLSGYFQEQGHITELLLNYSSLNDYDEVYISKVFSFTNIPIDLSRKEYSHIKVGGTGFFEDGGENLKSTIEHHIPDYNLYNPYISNEVERGITPSKFSDYIDYSIGFTTRGCFRKCSFCVNKKYNKVFRHSLVSEFLDTNRKYIYLWDDNFLGYSNWREVLDELAATGKYFQFRQGLDIRLMTEEKAIQLSKAKYKGDFIFAFDHIKDRDIIEANLKLWRTYSKKSTKLYVLCAYESQDEQDIISVFERIKILMENKCIPYIMRYENYKGSEYEGMYITIARWCNQPNFFKKKSFREFCEANQLLAKTDNKCAAMRYLEYFENKHPEIALKYFDMKYELKVELEK